MPPQVLVPGLLLARLEKVFLIYYVKVLDYHDGLIISGFSITLDFARKMKDEFDVIETEKLV